MRPSQLREKPPNFPTRPSRWKWKLYVLAGLLVVYALGWWWSGMGRPYMERVRIPVKVVPWSMRIHAPPLPLPHLDQPAPVVLPPLPGVIHKS